LNSVQLIAAQNPSSIVKKKMPVGLIPSHVVLLMVKQNVLMTENAITLKNVVKAKVNFGAITNVLMISMHAVPHNMKEDALMMDNTAALTAQKTTNSMTHHSQVSQLLMVQDVAITEITAVALE
jgi:hypothetical protein